ncbi:tRNA-specific adenosine deaminase [Arenibacter antarcticus]|uniref:Nucleoside deaminase n=1 Tax=Arenibacter antarcticus TaxID=2040469 RepID=A0ABW5VDJ8_9FLAO|nr:nucleoside deaminase [Arenibacter sp. H213]MCM4169237.1 hypothetical protein [Arenibacter sp. H213]
MDLIENIVHFFKKPKEETEDTSPEGTCPVCWGYQEYDHKIRQLFKDKQIDVNNHQYNYMKIQKFMVKYIDGIRLKQGDIKECPTCGGKSNLHYTPIEEQPQSKTESIHIKYMKQCIALAKTAMANENFPVGALVVQNNRVIGKASEAGKSSNDVTKHAEIEAIKDALKNTGSEKLEDCDLYTTHEPCIMCSYVIRHYRLRTVIYGTEGDQGGITSDLKVMLTTNFLAWGKPPIIIGNILEQECKELSNDYFKLN